MFEIYVDITDNSPITENENLAAFIYMPEVDAKDYTDNPAQFRKLLKQHMENMLNG